jgi:restriction system protein
MDPEFQYSHDLLELLVETIPRLSKSKQSVLLFFQGAGVPNKMYRDLDVQLNRDRDSLSKFHIARTVLTRLNEAGDAALKARREILKRVTEFEDFSTCYEEERLKAQGLVARVREVVNVKDSFTRINIERERERQAYQAEQQAKIAEVQAKKSKLDSVKNDLYALFSAENPHARGKQLEAVLNQLFRTFDVLVRESFALAGPTGEGIIEQIDGVIELDGNLYLVELKWWTAPLGPNEVAPHLNRMFLRGNVGGIVISASGYTDAAIATCREALSQKTIVLCELKEIVMLLENERDLPAMLRQKLQAARIDKNPLFTM